MDWATCVLHGIDAMEAKLARYERALELIGERENWLNDPLEIGAVMFGHFTPFELAREALDGHWKPRGERVGGRSDV